LEYRFSWVRENIFYLITDSPKQPDCAARCSLSQMRSPLQSLFHASN